ncbi:Uncharacterised protein [Klebsiella pneumoniae]|nr:Uncharacterised protein [Klebsiella pneumoniae]SWW58928.1 Uncharacterised protein [Klebsiella pneumoniae]
MIFISYSILLRIEFVVAFTSELHFIFTIILLTNQTMFLVLSIRLLSGICEGNALRDRVIVVHSCIDDTITAQFLKLAVTINTNRFGFTSNR